MKVRVEKLNINFDGETILKDFDLEVREGEFVTVLGRSGSGKTTLLNTISGTVKPDEGRVFVSDREVTGISSHVAYMPQDALLLPWKNVLDNVILYGRINGSKAQARQKALENMEFFGLKGYEHKYPAELSGGMKQRAAFLRTALCGAETMLLDEPFASLDIMTRREMQVWLGSMKTRLKKTVLMVTHDIDEALLLSDRIIVLGGRPAVIEREFVLDSSRTADEIRGEIWEILLN